MASPPARVGLEAYLAAGLAAVHAGRAIARNVRCDDGGLWIAGERIPDGAGLRVAAVGKAAAPMACALDEVAGDRIRDGLVITGEGLASPSPRSLRLREAAHPVPDARGEAAARELLAAVASAPVEDVLVVLLSGGASAMTSCPAEGLTLDDLAKTTSALLLCGADIGETNTVRKHLSAFSGGRLAAAARCHRILVLAISDVRGDELDVIGSGPCQPDPSRYADALVVVERYALRDTLPVAVVEHLQAGAAGDRPESPKPGAAGFERVTHRLIARNTDARAAMVRAARDGGHLALDLGEVLSGEASRAGRRLAALGCSIRSERPVLLVAGGETVVTVRGRGCGGRSQELALAAAIELHRARVEDVTLLAVGSDGRDGTTDAAGAFADAGSVARGRDRGVRADERLADNDAYGFFDAESGLIRTGPTDTNVMDLVLLSVGASPDRAVVESSPPVSMRG